MNKLNDLWQKSPQTWKAYGLEWRFEYNPIAVKRTITATGLTLEVPLVAPGKFPSPQAWLESWAKKNKKRLPSLDQEDAVALELDLFAAPAPPAPVVEVEVVTEELTQQEEQERQILERQVERAFYDAGKALAQLRDRRLYRSTHSSFEQYCRERFVVKAKLEPTTQVEGWLQAVEQSGGKLPSGRIVKDIVDRIRERTHIAIAYQVGDVCEILVKDNPDLRGLGGCWCIVAEVREFSCVVRAWNGEHTVKEENLKDLGYSAAEKEEMRKLCERLVGVRALMAQSDAGAVLSALGKLKRSHLTPLESELLEVLEKDALR